MKKRLIALMLVLSMICSIIPVYAAGTAAGTLNLGQEVTVTLTPGEEIYYTFDAAGETRYYYYLTNLRPTDGVSGVGPIEIRPEGTNEGLHGTSYQYAGYEGTMAISNAADTVQVILRNDGTASCDFELGVALVTEGTATSMAFHVASDTMMLGEEYALRTIFEPAFSFEADAVSFSASNDIVDFDYYIGGVNLIAKSTGTTTITANCGSMSASFTLDVTLPASALDITSAAQTVSVPANERSVNYFKFTAPADAAGNYYTVYTDARDDLELKPLILGTDNFQSQAHDLVLYNGNDMVPGETYYVQMICHGASADNVTVELVQCTTPSGLEILGVCQMAAGEMAGLWVEYPAPNEYVPVTWSVDDSSIVNIVDAGNYSATVQAMQDGTATVTATFDFNGASLSVPYVIEVGDFSSGGYDNVVMDGDGGTFTLSDGTDTVTGVDIYTFEIPVGSSLRAEGLTTITDLTFWDPNRDAAGWMAFVPSYDEEGNRCGDEPVSGDILTADEVLDYVIPADEEIIFRAMWDGSDDDYYFHVYFETVGGEMTAGNSDDSWQTDSLGERVRKDGSATLADAMNWGILADPTHAEHGTFEGWLTYQRDGNGDWSVVDYIAQTTAAIFASAPSPSGVDVMYVAKWSGIPLNDYYDMFMGGSGGTNQPIPTYVVASMADSVWLTANPDGYLYLEFTAPADGLYMIGHVAWGCGAMIEDVSPAATHKYDHDIMYNGDPFCGPVYELKKDTTYTFTVWLDGPDQMFYIYNNVEATDISSPVTELTGYVGSYVEWYYDVYPANTFSGINDSTSSDPSVASDGGGANWDCSRVIRLHKAGTADVTVTLANGKSVTVKVTAVEPPVLTLGTPTTATLDAGDFGTWKFTAPHAGMYYVTADCPTGECELVPAGGGVFVNSFYSGTTSGIWLEMNGGEEAYVLVGNPYSAAQNYTILADEAPAVTGLTIDNWETYPTLTLYGIRANLEPLGAFDNIVSWSVSDPTIMDIAENYGNEIELIALKPGTVTVTATTASGIVGTGTFTVKEMKLDVQETFTIEPYEMKEIAFQAPADGKYFVYKPMDNTGMWVSGESMWTGTETMEGCWVTLAKDEYLYIEIYGDGQIAKNTSVTITEASKPITSMTLVTNPVLYTYDMGAVVEINALPFGACDIKEAKVADETIARVSDLGESYLWLDVLKAGVTTLTVTTEGGVTATCTLNVQDPGKIEIGQAVNVSLDAHQYEAYTFTVPEDGEYTICSTGLFEMEVFNENWAYWAKYDQMDMNLNKGDEFTLKVYTYLMGSSGTIQICKKEKVTSVALPNVTAVVGTTGQAMLSIAPTNGWLADYSEWSVADPSVAIILDSYYNGVVLKFQKTGTTTLKMVNGDVTCTATITVTDPIVVPADPSTPATVTPEAVDSALTEAIAQAQPGQTAEVVIKADEAATAAGTTVTKVELPVASLEAVAGANAVLTVQLSGATVQLDAQTMAAITQQANGATITLSVEKVETTTLTQKQQAVLKDQEVGLVITALVLSDGEPIGDFKGGSVKVSVPFTPPAGKDGSKYAVWYVAENGTLEKMPTSFENNVITFTTKHFSDYVVMEGTPATNPATGDSFMLIPALLLFAVSAAMIVVVSKKRRV